MSILCVLTFTSGLAKLVYYVLGHDTLYSGSDRIDSSIRLYLLGLVYVGPVRWANPLNKYLEWALTGNDEKDNS